MRHLKENSETYLSHLKFAGKMGLQLILRGSLFILHGVFPFYNMPDSLNLNNTCKLINKWDSYAKNRRRIK